MVRRELRFRMFLRKVTGIDRLEGLKAMIVKTEAVLPGVEALESSITPAVARQIWRRVDRGSLDSERNEPVPRLPREAVSRFWTIMEDNKVP